MEMKFLFAGAILFAGWMTFYLFIRQLLFDFFTAYPLVKKIRDTDENLISSNANKFTTTSVAVCLVFIIAFVLIIIKFCKLYLILSYFIGVVIGFISFGSKVSFKNKSSFEAFCLSYYRFVPDDILRTAMYNKKISSMKIRLHEMGLNTNFIPSFNN